ncbi:ATP-binding cassette domain-containing protein [uncultured Jatrophihabitans sp.]|uniref:ATP-binding cassette domain-containing protein n=1 Tax=uncultured Jatrophihabitans sp. TaxID=1610747 RepID=UPI0035CAC0A6
MSDPPPALTARGIRVRRGGRDVLHDVDLAVSAGEIVAVLGPNGAGKSTLIGALAGTLPISQGSVTAAGRRALLMQTPGLARRSVRANVELALAWWGVPRVQRRPRAVAALERMQAEHLARRPAAELSGGEARRVHLARALALDADVLLLDEPFDGLDPQTHADLRDDTAEALRASGAAVAVVLHDRRDAWAMADRLVVLIDGAVGADAPPRELLAHPPSRNVARFLGYDGELVIDGRAVLTRAQDVFIATDAGLDGKAVRVVPVEDGARVRVVTDVGTVWATDRLAVTRAGDHVLVRVVQSVDFETPDR